MSKCVTLPYSTFSFAPAKVAIRADGTPLLQEVSSASDTALASDEECSLEADGVPRPPLSPLPALSSLTSVAPAPVLRWHLVDVLGKGTQSSSPRAQHMPRQSSHRYRPLLLLLLLPSRGQSFLASDPTSSIVTVNVQVHTLSACVSTTETSLTMPRAPPR